MAGARDLLAALLPDRERVLGPDHPGTLATRHNLASLTSEAGDVAGARDLLAALLSISSGSSDQTIRSPVLPAATSPP